MARYSSRARCRDGAEPWVMRPKWLPAEATARERVARSSASISRRGTRLPGGGDVSRRSSSSPPSRRVTAIEMELGHRTKRPFVGAKNFGNVLRPGDGVEQRLQLSPESRIVLRRTLRSSPGLRESRAQAPRGQRHELVALAFDCTERR